MAETYFDSVIVTAVKQTYAFNFFDRYIDNGLSGRGFVKDRSNVGVVGYAVFVLQENKDFTFEFFEDV